MLTAESGTRLTEPMRQVCPLLVEAEMRASKRGSGYDPNRSWAALDCCNAKLKAAPHFSARNFLF
jgi:hypothetical protein